MFIIDNKYINDNTLKKLEYLEIQAIYIERMNSNYFKIYISEPIKISKKKSVLEITEFLNQVLEKMILKNIDQWIWTHDRWKS